MKTTERDAFASKVRNIDFSLRSSAFLREFYV